MPVEFREVIEGIGPAELAGANQAHEQVAHAGAAVCLLEEGILAVQDGPFQRPRANIVVERGTRHAQEQRQPRPMLQQVSDGPAQCRVGLHQPYDKPSENPITCEKVTARRRRLRREFELPLGDEYGEFVRRFLSRP